MRQPWNSRIKLLSFPVIHSPGCLPMKGEQKPVASTSHGKNQRFQTLSTIPFIIIIISFFIL